MQLKVIDKLTAVFEDVKKQKAFYEKKQFDTERNKKELHKLTKNNENLLLRVRILEQNLHAALGEQNKFEVKTAKILRERNTFKNMLQESVFAVQAAHKMNHWSTIDPSRDILDRKIVLTRILNVINQYCETHAESMESLVLLCLIYEKGDLDFEVKKDSRRLQSVLAASTSLRSFEDKRSAILVFSASSSSESLKTIPSIELLPANDELPPQPVDTLPSFYKASTHSSSSEKSADIVSDITKQVAVSNFEMQKSLMADLAKLSSGQRESWSKLDTISQKSVNLSESGKLDDKNIDQEQKTIPEKDESKRTDDTYEKTEGTDELTKDTSEASNETNTETVDKEGMENDETKKTGAE